MCVDYIYKLKLYLINTINPRYYKIIITVLTIKPQRYCCYYKRRVAVVTVKLCCCCAINLCYCRYYKNVTVGTIKIVTVVTINSVIVVTKTVLLSFLKKPCYCLYCKTALL